MWLCSDSEAVKMVQSSGIELNGARIDGELDLSWLKMEFQLSASGCFFTKSINLNWASVRSLALEHTYIMGLNDRAFNGDGLTVEGSVDLLEFETAQPFSLRNARIGGKFDSQFARFYTGPLPYNGPIEPGLDLTSTKVASGVDLFGAMVKGETRLDGVEITGNLDSQGGRFGAAGRGSSPEGIALSGASMKVTGDVLFAMGFATDGLVVLSRSTIGGNLDCNRSKFHGYAPDQALDAALAKIDGDVILGVSGEQYPFEKLDFRADGTLSFQSASIGGALKLTGPESPNGAAVDLRALDLRDANARVLSNNERSWPKPQNLLLQGFVFSELGEGASLDPKVQIKWLRLQSPFVTQPYERIATVFRNMGYEEASIKVSIAEKWDEGLATVGSDLQVIAFAATHWQIWRLIGTALRLVVDVLWFFGFGWLIQYGYRPWNALLISIGFVLFGWMVFGKAREHFILTKKENYPFGGGPKDRNFSASIYSLETFVPLVKLGVAEYWRIDANRLALKALRFGPVTIRHPGIPVLWYYWIHIIAGWIFTSLWVAAFTGILKH
jgi:hypothetical protein